MDGYLKSKVYVICTRIITEFEQNVREQITAVLMEMVQQVMGNLLSRVQQFLLEDGRH
jgi:uncharacterized metal-binding protein YceD (DUF177 family)